MQLVFPGAVLSVTLRTRTNTFIFHKLKVHTNCEAPSDDQAGLSLYVAGQGEGVVASQTAPWPRVDKGGARVNKPAAHQFFDLERRGVRTVRPRCRRAPSDARGRTCLRRCPAR